MCCTPKQVTFLPLTVVLTIVAACSTGELPPADAPQPTATGTPEPTDTPLHPSTPTCAPRISPLAVGGRIVCSSDRADDGGPGDCAAWSPDGNHIVFASDRSGNPDLGLMNASGSGPVQVINDEAIDLYPGW